jgi:hypothetical protein
VLRVMNSNCGRSCGRSHAKAGSIGVTAREQVDEAAIRPRKLKVACGTGRDRY